MARTVWLNYGRKRSSITVYGGNGLEKALFFVKAFSGEFLLLVHAREASQPFLVDPASSHMLV